MASMVSFALFCLLLALFRWVIRISFCFCPLLTLLVFLSLQKLRYRIPRSSLGNGADSRCEAFRYSWHTEGGTGSDWGNLVSRPSDWARLFVEGRCEFSCSLIGTIGWGERALFVVVFSLLSSYVWAVCGVLCGSGTVFSGFSRCYQMLTVCVV